MLERKVVVRLSEGLHARPATQFVKLARGFAADLEVVREGKAANAKSSVKLMLLGVKEDEEIVLRANGADEADAIEALAQFVGSADASDLAPALQPLRPAAPPPEAPAASPVASSLPRGAPASEGAAIGPAFVFLPAAIDSPACRLDPDEIEGELARLADAVKRVEIELLRRAARAAPRSQEAEIIAALGEIGRDEELTRRIEALVYERKDAVTAAIEGGGELARQFQAMEDPYIRARARTSTPSRAKSRSRCSAGARPRSARPVGAVVSADEISAFDLAGAPLKSFGGLVALKGGPTSHIAIIARSYGVPAVLGAARPARLARRRRSRSTAATGEVVARPGCGYAGHDSARMARSRRPGASLAAYAASSRARATAA